MRGNFRNDEAGADRPATLLRQIGGWDETFVGYSPWMSPFSFAMVFVIMGAVFLALLIGVLVWVIRYLQAGTELRIAQAAAAQRMGVPPQAFFNPGGAPSYPAQ